jgi:DNA invertase Pin-like site-specific DNA recombinase
VVISTQSPEERDAIVDRKESVLANWETGTGGIRWLEKLVEEGKITELVVEEFSRLGRNTGDVVRTLEFLEKHEVNVHVRNLGLQSRPNGKKNPIWKLISTVMSSLYEMELENIKERTATGRQVFVQRGGRLGRPEGTSEGDKKFLEKEKSKEIIKLLNKVRTIREISKLSESSFKTVIKTKRVAIKYGLVSSEN